MKQSTKILIEVLSEEGTKMLINLDSVDIIASHGKDKTKIYSKNLGSEFISDISYEDIRSKLDIKATVVRHYE